MKVVVGLWIIAVGYLNKNANAYKAHILILDPAWGCYYFSTLRFSNGENFIRLLGFRDEYNTYNLKIFWEWLLAL